MNELLNHLNNYAKKRKNKHRFSAVMVCLAVIVSFTVYIGLIEPAESASGQLDCGMEEHEHTQDCFELICGFDDESEEEISVDTTEIGSEETTETACETEETTTETTETTTSTEVEETAPVHVHNDECYRLICLTEAHLHKQDCYNQPVETTEPAATETSASISTGTTMSTEQTTETTTTTTKLSEEVYELNAALFGELYMDRVSVLADSPVYIDEYKFYYANEMLNINDEYFEYGTNGNTNPNYGMDAINEKYYNGQKYSSGYNFAKRSEAYRYVKFKIPDNELSDHGVLIMLFDGDSYTINLKITEGTEVVEQKTYSFTNGEQGLVVIPVEKDKGYTVSQNTKDTADAKLAYAEFVPTVTPVDGGTYRIRNVKTGLYVEVEDAGTKNSTKIKTGQYSYDDKRNDFKFEDAGSGNFYIYPQLDYSNSANGIQMLDYSSSGDIQTYSTGDIQSNRKFKFNYNNDNGTYKINSYVRKSTTVVNLYVDNNYVKASETATGDDFIIVEATEMVKPEVVYSPANIDGKTYLIKNVRSRQYIHMEAEVYRDSDGNIIYKKNYTDEEWDAIDKTYSTEQIIQMKDVGADSQFKFISTGTAGEYYIVSTDEKLALTTNWNFQNGADVRYGSFENSIYRKDLIFHAEKMENGSVRFYQENNGKKYYLGIPYTTVAAGANIALYEADSVEDQMCFFLVPVIEPVEVEEKHTRVEARVIFADYNDGKFELYKDTDDKVKSGEKQAGDVKTNERNLYDEPAWIPKFSLYKNENLEENKDGNLVVDVSEARKDWCYQYNYVWDLGESNTNDYYYVALNGVDSENKITLNGKTFRVHYLKDTELGHPGQCNKNDPYSQSPSYYNQTGDQIIYIFLDPVVEEWWPNGNQPGTFDLSMKKRWDGHNSDGFDNRKKEKIQIQLQRLNSSGQWVEYKPEAFGETYTFKCYFEVVDVNGKNKRYVDLRKFLNYKENLNIPDDTNVTNIKRTLTNNGAEYTIVYNNETYTFSEDDFNYEDLKKHNCLFEKESGTLKRANLELGYNEWNNVVLTVDGNNNPTHFTNGYYFNWKAIPYGQYRVIETQSFYDANENDVFDEGDRDTSNEYYYMSYPPMRDSRGVLHIQNFTKDMVLDIQKEWYDNTGTEKMDNPGKTVKVNIYRSLEKIDDPKKSDFGDAIYSNVEVKDDNIILKTTDKHPELLLKTTSEQKYYYYIQEVSVDGYLLLNGNDEGFVKSTNGNYYVDYEDGDGRKFIITNKAKIGLRVEKEWYNNSVSDENKIDYYNNNTDNPIYPKFNVYKGDRPGTPVVNDDICSVNGVALEKIADVTIGKDGYFELVSDENDKHGDSSYVNDELNMLSDTKYELVSTGFDGNIFRNASDHPANIQGDYIVVDNTNRFWVGSNKTKNNQVEAPYITGTLTLEFENYDENSILSVGNRCTINGKESNEAKYYNIKDANGVVSIPGLYVDGNYRIMGNNCTLNIKKVTFTHDAYYYIQEITNDNSNYTLSNGDSNGFVKIGDNFYTTITANNRYPVVTAQNIPKVNLDITKEWTQSNANISKVMNFEIYKAFAQGTPVADGEGYKVTVNNADYQLTKNDGTYKTNGEGNLDITNLPAFEEKDGTYHKLYYYVREIEGNYTTSNAINGFIPYESGQYGTAFDDTSSNSGKYKFTNTPKLEITVNKTWLDADGKTDYNNSSKEMKCILYRTTNTTNDPNSDYLVGEYVTENRTKLIQNLVAYDSSGKKYNYYIVEISSDGNYSVDNYIVTYSETNVSWNKDGKQPVINVTNQAKPQNYELPETGGSGTHGYTVAGGAIILLSAMILLFKRRTQL